MAKETFRPEKKEGVLASKKGKGNGSTREPGAKKWSGKGGGVKAGLEVRRDRAPGQFDTGSNGWVKIGTQCLDHGAWWWGESAYDIEEGEESREKALKENHDTAISG